MQGAQPLVRSGCALWHLRKQPEIQIGKAQYVRSDSLRINLIQLGKVRDIYDLGDKLLLVASDRISAFDVILPTPIPGKGKILTELSEFWFGQLADIVPHHLITTNVDGFSAACPYFLMCRRTSASKSSAVMLKLKLRKRGPRC